MNQERERRVQRRRDRDQSYAQALVAATTSPTAQLAPPFAPSPPSDSIVSTPRTAPVRRWVRHSRNPSWTSTRSLAKMLGKLVLQSATRHPRWREVRCPRRRRRRAQLDSPPRRGDQIGVRDRGRLGKSQRELTTCSALPARRLAWAVSEMQGWRLSESPLPASGRPSRASGARIECPGTRRARWAGMLADLCVC